MKNLEVAGSLIVSYRMVRYEAIRNILRSWIPNIVILAPEGFKMIFYPM